MTNHLPPEYHSPSWIDAVLAVLVTIALVVICITMGGCGSLDRQYVAADRATYDALTPQITTWIDADTTLSETLAGDYRSLVYSWGRRIDAAEELLETSE